MLDRIIGQLALALFRFIEGRIDKGSTAIDADIDMDGMRRSGARVRKWMREQDDLRARIKSDADR